MNLLELTISQWVQVIASIGTVLAAIAAWYSSTAAKRSVKVANNQLEEMKAQRIEAQKPYLILREAKNIEIPKPEGLDYKRKIEIPLDNVGNGVAVKVEVKMYLELESFSCAFENEEIMDLMNLKIKENNKMVSFDKTIKSKKGMLSTHTFFYIEDIVSERLNFLKANDSIELDIPDIIVTFLDSFSTVVTNIQKNKIKMPYFLVELCYYDSFNKKYTDRSIVSISNIYIEKPETEKTIMYSLTPQIQ